mmetsp:Transcript_130595/g.309825  ORF Transcript_130595/g.309825 Transcript_130595/m.309825 type:complete len:229 (-) Transcript_130595:90-776(-)
MAASKDGASITCRSSSSRSSFSLDALKPLQRHPARPPGSCRGDGRRHISRTGAAPGINEVTLGLAVSFTTSRQRGLLTIAFRATAVPSLKLAGLSKQWPGCISSARLAGLPKCCVFDVSSTGLTPASSRRSTENGFPPRSSTGESLALSSGLSSNGLTSRFGCLSVKQWAASSSLLNPNGLPSVSVSWSPSGLQSPNGLVITFSSPVWHASTPSLSEEVRTRSSSKGL